MSNESKSSIKVESVSHSFARVRVSKNVALSFRATKENGKLIDSDLVLAYSSTPAGISYYSVKESSEERGRARRAARVAINKTRK